MIYFTADHHFGHANIIQYCQRPFKDADHMNEIMIARWVEIVHPDSTVFYLGDFTLQDYSTAQKYINRLTGNIKFLPGSHDKWLYKVIDNWLYPNITECKVPQLKCPIVLCHYAMRSWPRSFHGSYHLYGHSHGRLEETRQPRSMDVGVDCWDFYPVSLETVIAKLSQDKNEALD